MYSNPSINLFYPHELQVAQTQQNLSFISLILLCNNLSAGVKSLTLEESGIKSLNRITMLLALFLLISVVQVYGQITTPCTSNMLNSVTPCLNFITQNNVNISTPSSDCCNSLKTLTGASMSCACLVVSGNVPLQIPINRTLAISLPRACNMGGVPLQCKASATPLPAPGPISFPPAPSPTAVSVPDPSSSSPTAEPDTPSALTPTSSTPGTSTGTPGSRPVLTPSSAPMLSTISVPSLLLVVLGIWGLKYY